MQEVPVSLAADQSHTRKRKVWINKHSTGSGLWRLGKTCSRENVKAFARLARPELGAASQGSCEEWWSVSGWEKDGEFQAREIIQ